MTPSRDHHERIGDDEATRFAGYAAALVALQRSRAEGDPGGRALHRKGHLGLRGLLRVKAGLPDHARYGLFARPETYEVKVRLSNGSGARASDRKPDVRGFAFSVLGVHGESVHGGPAESQDFALIPLPALPFPTVDEFMGFALASSKSPVALVAYLAKRYGITGLGRVGRRLAAFTRSFPGFANTTFFSAAPIACGPYAIRVRLSPLGAPRARDASRSFAEDVADRLRDAPLRYELAAQFFVDETRTPIEDPSVDWDESVAPYVAVAELELSRQDPDTDAGRELAAAIEHATFDPWSALVEHRPLGAIMRARKVAYFESQKARGVVHGGA